MSQESGLYLTTKASMLAIPKLSKVATIIKGNDNLIEMPIDAELGREFKFHNIFICPVSKEISTKDNPP